MPIRFRQVLFGRPLATSQASHERLPKRLAFGVFSSDALSSTAYATEEILRVLLLAGAGALALSWPIGVGIAALLLIVAGSYRQTLFAYPDGGGSYTVARANLGDTAGLTAAASLLIDYVLTVAVSVAAGVAALVSAFPSLQPSAAWLCLAFILLLALANLRGLKESGAVVVLPTFAFAGAMSGLVIWGLFRAFTSPAAGPGPATDDAVRAAVAANGGVPAGVSLFLILRAFSSGCTALTGVEAFSNGVPAFRRPEAANAAKVLTATAFTAAGLFLGLTFLADRFHVPALPEDSPRFETVISQVAAAVLGGKNLFYYVVQFATAAVLAAAANRAYAEFPRLASRLARDRFLPRQLGDLGDRLVYNNGILLLTVLVCALVLLFNGSVASLVPLYAVGVFLSFTLSQAGMVRHWFREKGPAWAGKAAVSLIGTLATGVAAVVIGVTRFNAGQPTGLRLGGVEVHYGAWIVALLIPALVLMFRAVRGHYREVAQHLRAEAFGRMTPDARIRHTVLVLVPGLHRGIVRALEYARSLSPDARAVYVETDPANTAALKEEWDRTVEGVALVIIESPFRTLREPLTEYVREVRSEQDEHELTVVIPELVATRKWWHGVLHSTAANALRRALSQLPGVVVTNYRYFAREAEANGGGAADPTAVARAATP